MDWSCPWFLRSAPRRIKPPTLRSDLRIRLGWSPRARLVLVPRDPVAEYGIDDTPCLLDVVLTREADGIPVQRIEQELFVGAHLGGIRRLGNHELDLVPVQRLAGLL